MSDAQLQRIFQLLLPASGVNFAQYKTATIIRRLFRRMALLRILDVDAYVAHLAETPLEVVNLHPRHPVFPRARFVRGDRSRGASVPAIVTGQACARLGRGMRDRRRGVFAGDGDPG